MKLFEEPELILLQFSTEDVLTDSSTENDDMGEWS